MPKAKPSFFTKLKQGLVSFFTTEAVSSLFLLFFAGLALFMANSSFHELYKKIIYYPFSIQLGDFGLQTSLHYAVNEGFMALFFFVVGMEIKRELMEGELSSARKAAFPLLAAIGGSAIPALIFFYFNEGLPTEKGWGIAMATDIAFAVGVLSLLSHKVPFALKIFLLSVAIIDDIIAVLVIALFYSQEVTGPFLAMIFILSCCIFLYFKLRIHNIPLLSVMAIAMWVCFYHSGIHATLSGVLLGSLVPHQHRWTEQQVLSALTKMTKKKETTSLSELKSLKVMMSDTKSLLQRLISFYHPYVSYIIMPLFAFTNAGIPIGDLNLGEWIQNPVSYGIILGLCVGKPLGITAFSYLSCKVRLCDKPESISWYQIISVGFLAGIGFTMSLFIMNLCFDLNSAHFAFSKLSVLVASALAGLTGLVMLSFGKTVPIRQRMKPPE